MEYCAKAIRLPGKHIWSSIPEVQHENPEGKLRKSVGMAGGELLPLGRSKTIPIPDKPCAVFCVPGVSLPQLCSPCFTWKRRGGVSGTRAIQARRPSSLKLSFKIIEFYVHLMGDLHLWSEVQKTDAQGLIPLERPSFYVPFAISL